MNKTKEQSRLATLLGVTLPYPKITWPLPNIEPCEETEYWHWMSTWGTPKEQTWSGGQLKIAEHGGGAHGQNPRWANVFVSLIDHSELIGGGFAVVFEYWADHNKVPEPQVRYYKWRTCAHEFTARRVIRWHTARNLGRCYNEYTCKHCGGRYTVDSSD